jgi:hypothetical protein
MVEDAERPMIVQGCEEVEGFEIVGTGLFRCAGSDVQIAEIHQRVGDGVLIPLRALDCEHFSVAGFCVIQVAREGADVAQIAERIGEGAVIIGQAIIRDSLFVRGFSLRELAAVEKNSCAMFVGVSHDLTVASDQLSAFPDSELSTFNSAL